MWLAGLAAACALWFGLSGPALVRLHPSTRLTTRIQNEARSGSAGIGRAPITSANRQTSPKPLRQGFVGAVRSRFNRRPVPEVSWVCELLALSLEAGSPPRVALAHVAAVTQGPARTALVGVLHHIELGVDEADAWRSLAVVPGFGGMARDIARSLRRGSALAHHLRRHAHQFRQETHARALARARVAGVRSVLPLVVCFLPAFLLVGVVPVLAGSLLALLG